MYKSFCDICEKELTSTKIYNIHNGIDSILEICKDCFLKEVTLSESSDFVKKNRIKNKKGDKNEK